MTVVKGIFKRESKHQWKEYEEILLQLPNGDEDISIITFEGYKKLKNDEIKGFCHNKFKANLIIEGLNNHVIICGTILTIGEALLEITKVGKACHRECPALVDKRVCTLKQHIFFAKVIRSGKIKVNNKVSL